MAKKNLGGRPPKYGGQRKNNVTISLSLPSIEGLDSMAESLGVSRSELIERVGRGIYPINTMPVTESTPALDEQDLEIVGELSAS
ncbi:MAG TPA: ribbon-helix-helix domain-containing protein [Candidatus Obscuribacterales bacterium]